MSLISVVAFNNLGIMVADRRVTYNHGSFADNKTKIMELGGSAAVGVAGSVNVLELLKKQFVDEMHNSGSDVISFERIHEIITYLVEKDISNNFSGGTKQNIVFLGVTPEKSIGLYTYQWENDDNTIMNLSPNPASFVILDPSGNNQHVQQRHDWLQNQLSRKIISPDEIMGLQIELQKQVSAEERSVGMTSDVVLINTDGRHQIIQVGY